MQCQSTNYLRYVRFGTTALALATLLLTGCGESIKRLEVHPVQGKITYQGKSPAGAIVVLHPVDNSEPDRPRPTAKVEDDGTFVVKTYNPADGAPPGKYKVTVQLRKFEEKNDGSLVAGPHLVPERYSQIEKTDLHVEVVAGNNVLQPIVLRR
jgi:hypothetical protein